jgi:excisionase family DNA binding protein
MTSRTISVEQAGTLVGVSRASAYEAARSGAIPSLKIGRRVVVPVAKLAEILGETPEALAQMIEALESNASVATQRPHAHVA